LIVTASSVPGTVVEVGPVDVSVDEPLASTRLGPRARLVADRTRAVIRVPAVATFGVEDGHRVVIEPCGGVARDEIDAWMQGLITPLLLAQRGRFALHANLVELDGGAVAVAGARGAGKTTTSLVLERRGARTLGDDVARLSCDDGALVSCSATGRPLRIAPETAATLGLDVTGAKRAGRGQKKILLPCPAVPPRALSAVVVLTRATAPGVRRRDLLGADAVRAILLNAYRVRLLRPIWRAELFNWAGAIAGRVPVHVVRRPAGRWSADDVAAAVESVATEAGCG
jgi:hypothetical protein